MNIRLIPLLLSPLAALLGLHLIQDTTLHTDYIGFGLMFWFLAGLLLVLALEPILDRR